MCTTFIMIVPPLIKVNPGFGHGMGCGGGEVGSVIAMLVGVVA
jgi:hypothetical protein